MDKVRLDSICVSTQSAGGTGDREWAKEMPESRTPFEGARRAAAQAVRAFPGTTICNRYHFQTIQAQGRRAGIGGSQKDLIASLVEVLNPIQRDGRTAICDKQQAHEVTIPEVARSSEA
jgi:hypothetical protein